MLDQKEQIKNFAFGFFKNLKCTLIWRGEYLEVSNVPLDFESFYGKKAPYVLSFDSTIPDENAELMTRGSYLLRRMAEYMDQRGQTTLLKWDIDIDPKELISQSVSLKNAAIASFTKKHTFNLLFRFTFATTFQYLNEKEQMMNTVYVHNGEVVAIDVPKEQLIEGKKSDVSTDGTENAYNNAKDHIRTLLDTKSTEVKKMLRERLERERARIKAHYEQRLREYDEGGVRMLKQIAELEEQIANPEIKEKRSMDAKLKRLRETLDALQKNDQREKIKKEEEFFLRDEVAKHGLAITNKLINTSIIYYPVFNITLFLKNADAGRLVETEYHPFKKQLLSLPCESCRSVLSELWLCTGGHVLCKACTALCPTCRQVACASCVSKACEYCSRKSCKKCLIRCTSCNKNLCASHLLKERTVNGCVCCTKRCPQCTVLTPNDKMKLCPTCAAPLCTNCTRKQTLKFNGQPACARCVQECTLCAIVRKKEYFPPCRECKFSTCNHGNICSICRIKIGVKPRSSRA